MTLPVQTRRILGVDPGSQNTGYGIVEDRGQQLICRMSGVIKTMSERSLHTTPASQTSHSEDSSNNLPQRLHMIYNGLSDLVRQHQPQVMVVESVFQAANAQSALKLGHARGIALLVAAQFKLEFYEYATRAIKKGLTGSGAAGKDQVQKMVRLLLRGSESAVVATSLDATDALAAAIYHCHLNPWLKNIRRAGAQDDSLWLGR